MIEDVCTTLSNASVGTAGTSLFAHYLPETTGLAVGVFEIPGRDAIERFGNTRGIERPRVRVVCRSTAPADGQGVAVPTNARAKAAAAWAALDAVTNTTIAGSTYLRMVPLQSPYADAQDQRARHLFTFTAEIWRQA